MFNANFDVVIVGASLAGLCAGRRLKAAGVENFLIVDQKSSIGLPLKCGEAVEAAVLEELFPDSRYARWLLRRVNKHSVQFDDTEREFHFDYCELDRPGFEQWLAKDLGPHLRLSTRIEQVQRELSGIVLNTNHGWIKGKGLVLASGTNYKFHRPLGLLREEPRLGYAFGGLFEGAMARDDRFIWRLSREANGYAWLFPKSDREVNVGAAGMNAKKIRDTFEDFRTQHSLGEAKCHLGGKYPVTGPIRKTFTDRVLVAGDAAGMVYAGTGEGIAYALLSGTYAGDVMARAVKRDQYSSETLKEYRRLWHARFGKKLSAGVRFQKQLTFLLRSGHLKNIIKHIPEPMLRQFFLDGRIPPRFWLKGAYLFLRRLFFPERTLNPAR